MSSDVAPGYYELMETAVRELLVEHKLINAGEIRRQVEVLDSRTPALGGRVVARAWVDPQYNLVYVFLSNRIYPDASNEKLSKLNIRTTIQQIIYESILK